MKTKHLPDYKMVVSVLKGLVRGRLNQDEETYQLNSLWHIE